jgi:hypothetical protein
MDSRTNCYSLVWEKPENVYIAVRKSLRFERDTKVPNIPIEISSDVFSLETQKSCYLNPCHDAHVILGTLMRTARHYRSVIVFNKGEPCVRWINSNGTTSTIDLVVDSSDVVKKLAQERADAFARWTLFSNVFVFGMVALMFVQIVCSANEMRLVDYI